MVKKIAFTMYPVKNMDRARNFYENDLGLKLSSNNSGAWVEYDLSGGCLALTTLSEGVSPSANAGGSIAFEVENVDELTFRLRSKGIQIKVPPFATSVCRMSVVIDPEGNAIILHQLTKRS